MNEYKNIVLLKGLEHMNDYQFRKIKSLLRKELKLTNNMQDKFDKIQLADLMEDKFPKDAGLDKVIKVCELIEELQDLAKNLKKEKTKVQKKKKGKGKMAVNKRKQDELSTSESLSISNESNKNKPSSKKKRKQITKTEGGKKKKFTQEQTQLPEPSGINIKKDDNCLQTPPKPPPTPPSSSSNKKKRKKITKTEGGKKKKFTEEQTQLPEPSGINIKKDDDCLQTPPKPPPTPPSSSSNKKQKNKTIQKHSITEDPQEKQQLGEFSSTKNFQALSEIPPFEGCSAIASRSLQSSQKLLKAQLDLQLSPGSPTSTCQNFPVSPASDSSFHLISSVPATRFIATRVPHIPSATAFSNVEVPLMPPETVFSFSGAPQLSPVTVPSSIQNLRLSSPAAFSSTKASHSQATASRNVQTTRVPSATLTSKAQLIKMPPPATAFSNAQIPHPQTTMSRSISVAQVPQTTTSSSTQTLNSATVKAFKNVQAPQICLTSRAKPTQIYPGIASFFIQAPHAPPATVSRSVCPTQLTQGAASCTDNALSLPKVKASSKVQAPQVSSPIASSSLQASHAASPTASSSLQASHATSPTASSSLQASRATSPTASSSLLAPCATSPTACRSLLASHATSATASSSLQASHATSATASSSLQASRATSATASSNHLALQLSPTTASRALHATPGLSAIVHSSPTRTPRRGIVPKEPSKEEGHQKGPKQVMVLKVTEPFTYDMKEDKRMFHATVATETEFFRVKVFDTALKSKFIQKKIIAISDYFGCNGFLEIYRASCVSDVNVNQTMVISNTLRQRANATPKISYLFSQAKGTFVNGEFVVFKKTERGKFIYYGIEDDTGKMEVVVYGRLTNIKCEPGSKLRLVCFELTSTDDAWQLRSVRHSYMQVINARM